ncbi:MAG: hypothetical protein PF541_08060, partial [Prolixibacteraceae bacterium]|nr:hypothetical protein [Prolixibacteraceae bacterium]
KEIYIFNELVKSIKIVKIPHNIVFRLHYDKIREKIFYGSYTSELNSIDINTLKQNIEFTNPFDYSQLGIASNDSLIITAMWDGGIYIKHNNGLLEHPGESKNELTFSTLDISLDNDIVWLATVYNGLMSYSLETKNLNLIYLKKNQTAYYQPTKLVL